MAKFKEFKIRRKGWLRGGHKTWKSVTPSLRNEKGSMCCLGFFARACGVSADAIQDVSLPSGLLSEDVNKLPDETIQHEDDIANVNDDTALSSAEREKQLTKLFKELGYKPIFV